MRIAVIDLGTNTFHLLITEINGQTHHTICTIKVPVKLAEGSQNMKRICPKPFQRGIETLISFKQLIQKHNPARIGAFATSAIRDAKNGKEFTSTALREAGIHIQTIDGNKEAELIYHGVKQAVKLGPEPALIMDIGGGSTEFIIGNTEKILWKHSFNLGVSRIMEKLKPADPVTSQDIDNIHSLLKKELKPLIEATQKIPVNTLIGSSGSFDSYAEMSLQLYYNQQGLGEQTSFDFDLKKVRSIHQNLLGSTLEQRLKIKGLVPMRADMIVISSIFIQFIIETVGIEKMFLSTYAMKEGALWEMMNQNNW